MSKELITRTLQLDKVEMEIDLAGYFGVDSVSNDVAERIGQACIDHIIERTEKGKSVDGSRFDGYDKDYTESVEFAAWDKSPRKVNMTLRGDMLGTLDILGNESGRIKIGWSDDTEIKKAFNHNTGDTVPKREFFGLTQKQLEEIAAPFVDDVKSIAAPSDDAQDYLKLIGMLSASEQDKSNKFLLDLFWGQDGAD